MLKKSVLLAAAMGVFAAGCATTDPATGQRDVNRTATGAIIGAIGGAAVGAATNTSDSEQTRKNAIIGAGIGALTGAAVGAYMDEQEKKLRAQTAGTGIEVVRQGDEITLNMPSDITFDFDSAAVKPQFQGVLNDVARSLASADRTTVDVFGHADSTGSDQYNLALSQRRAQAVSQYLINAGVAPVRLVTRGFGEAQPIAPNDTEVNRAKNRRVEVRLRPVTA